MGTSNFVYENASKVYAVLMGHEEKYKQCQECLHRHYDWQYDLDSLTECENGCDDPDFEEESEYSQPEQWECEDFINQLQDDLQTQGFDSLDFWDNERNYSGKYIAEKTISKQYCGIWAEVNIKVIIRSGYYEGANLDWEVTKSFNSGGCEDLSESEIFDELVWCEVNKGLATIMTPYIIRWMDNESINLIEETEKFFEKVSMPLVVSARFSNGETWYKKA